MNLSGKKAIFVGGLKHHVTRLTYVFDALEKQGVDIHVLVGNNGENIDGFSEILIQQKRSFKMFYDYLDESLMEDINSEADRLCQQAASSETQQQSFRDYFGDEYFFFSIRDFVESWALIGRALDQEKPDFVFALYEGNFWTKILCRLAWERNIPVYAFQEGNCMVYEEMFGHLDYIFGEYLSRYSSKLLVWSETVKHLFMNQGVPASRLAVVGNTQLDFFYNADASTIKQKLITRFRTPVEKVILFAVSDLAVPGHNVQKHVHEPLQRLLSLLLKHPNWGLLVKWYPRSTSEVLADQYDAQLSGNGQVVTDRAGKLSDMMSGVDALTCVYTGCRWEALVADVPIFEFDASPMPEKQFEEMGVAHPLVDNEDMLKLERIVMGEEEACPSSVRKKVLKDFYGPAEGLVCDRVVKVIRQHMSEL